MGGIVARPASETRLKRKQIIIHKLKHYTIMINENIIGYDLVKNVKGCGGFERCGYDKLFVVRQHSGGDYLSALVEVRENTDENRREIEEKYGLERYHTCNDDYIVWGGCIVTLPKGSRSLPEGGDFIQFYWS